jgi:hypothetical protein
VIDPEFVARQALTVFAKLTCDLRENVAGASGVPVKEPRIASTDAAEVQLIVIEAPDTLFNKMVCGKTALVAVGQVTSTCFENAFEAASQDGLVEHLTLTP